MVYFKYNAEGQQKYAPPAKNNFLVGLSKDNLFNLPNDRDGEYKVRLLPPWSKQGAFAISSDVHYNVGVPPTTFVCSNNLEPGSCPFCAVHAQLRVDYKKNEADIVVISAKKRFYSNVINLAQPNLGVLVFPYGVTIYNFLDRYQNSGEYGDITDPENGHDLTIYRSKQGQRTNDVVMVSPKSTPIQNAEWLDQLKDLDTIIPLPNKDGAERAFRSHPWKIYKPEVKVAVKQQVEVADKPAKVVEEQQEKQGKSAAVTIDELEAKIRAKMAKASQPEI